ncbi:MAG TPA: alkaline phosphatase family protein [Gemmatimonadaceae bacterium]|nr:alkaline phosphatase family protein [Gemmatimonadaceae bacterium]
MLQIDALAYSDLRRALELGLCPTISRLLREGFALRRWFCGLPSATPYCQAGMFYGENGGIPAFRFYDKAARKVITCNAPHGVQYIRDRIKAPGALAGGSSYVNLLDGDAQTVAFTVATREKMSVYRRLGGTRMGLLILLHPVRMLRMVFQGAFEWLLEEWERARGELAGRVTHSEGIFPFIRILSNVVVRELQTMAILLDVYLGVPVIYSTFMQYDELAHHFGPSSKQALVDLRRTDARIAEIWRMAQLAGGRGYDLVILSDHGMTPALSYRVQYGESLGTTVQQILDATRASGATPSRSLASYAEDTEYADIGPEVVEAVAQLTPASFGARRAIRRFRDWLRSRYGLREIIFPEKYRVDRINDVVVTYSSCLALVYFANSEQRLKHEQVVADPRWSSLYDRLIAHPGIGLVATLSDQGVALASKHGRALLHDGTLTVTSGENPLEVFGTDSYVLDAIESLVQQPNAGDCVLFGSYDGYDIISFDDQVGAHGSAGGDQVYPFIISPERLGLAAETLVDARDIHRTVLARYAAANAENAPPEAARLTPVGAHEAILPDNRNVMPR